MPQVGALALLPPTLPSHQVPWPARPFRSIGHDQLIRPREPMGIRRPKPAHTTAHSRWRESGRNHEHRRPHPPSPTRVPLDRPSRGTGALSAALHLTSCPAIASDVVEVSPALRRPAGTRGMGSEQARSLRVVAHRYSPVLSLVCGPDVAPPWPRGPPCASCPGIQRPPHATSPRRGPGTRGAPLMPKDDVTVAGTCCWSTSPRRPVKSAAWSTKPVISTCRWSPVSAKAEMRWCAGPSYSKRSFHKTDAN